MYASCSQFSFLNNRKNRADTACYDSREQGRNWYSKQQWKCSHCCPGYVTYVQYTNLCAWLSSWMTDQLKVPGCVGKYRLDVDQIDNGSECTELWKVIASIARKQASSIHTIGYNMPVRNEECKNMVPPCCQKFQSCLRIQSGDSTLPGCCHSYSQLLCTHRARTRLGFEAEKQDLTHIDPPGPPFNGSNLWPWFPMDVTNLKPWC